MKSDSDSITTEKSVNSEANLQEYYEQYSSDYQTLPADLELEDSEMEESIIEWSIRSDGAAPRDVMIFATSVICGASILLGFLIYFSEGWLLADIACIAFISILTVVTCWIAISEKRKTTTFYYYVLGHRAKIFHNIHRPKAINFARRGVVFLICMLKLMHPRNILLRLSYGPDINAMITGPITLEWNYFDIHEVDSLSWQEYNFVIVDRKRRVIVTHQSDPTQGFKARLPNDELLEQYLAFLRTVLPPSAQFTEKKCNLSLI